MSVAAIFVDGMYKVEHRAIEAALDRFVFPLREPLSMEAHPDPSAPLPISKATFVYVGRLPDLSVVYAQDCLEVKLLFVQHHWSFQEEASSRRDVVAEARSAMIEQVESMASGRYVELFDRVERDPSTNVVSRTMFFVAKPRERAA